MFIGHFALGFAARRAAPRFSLAVLFAAAQLADMLWPFLLAAGVEQVRIDPGNTAFTPLDFVSYPYSHSLVMLAIWGVLLGLACTRLKVERATVVIAALVVSHWILDALTHRPDMPIYPGGPKVGLELWRSIPATMVVEGGMFLSGVSMYLKVTRARDRIGTWATWLLIALLLFFWLAAVGSPPPPGIGAVITVSIAGALMLTLLAWWADSHRTWRETPPAR